MGRCSTSLYGGQKLALEIGSMDMKIATEEDGVEKYDVKGRVGLAFPERLRMGE